MTHNVSSENASVLQRKLKQLERYVNYINKNV